MTIVIEVGGKSALSIIGAAQAVLGSLKGTIEIVSKGTEAEGEYALFNEGLEAALELLGKESISALLVQGLGPGKAASALLCCPHFGGDSLSIWHGVINGVSPSEFDFDSFIKHPSINKHTGIVFASVAVDDTLDLENIPEIEMNTFPWDHWRLVEAAVIDEHGCLQSRRGQAGTRTAKA